MQSIWLSRHYRSFILILTILFRVSFISSSTSSYPTFLLIDCLFVVGRMVALEWFTVASFECSISLWCQVRAQTLTSVKAPLRRARDLSWHIILNLSFRIGTVAIVICTSTISPTLNWAGSTLENLNDNIGPVLYYIYFNKSYLGGPSLMLSWRA